MKVLRADLGQRPSMPDTDIADEDVEPAKGCTDAIECRRDLARVGNIESERRCGAALSADLRLGSLEARGLAAVQDDMCAGFGEGFRNPVTRATRLPRSNIPRFSDRSPISPIRIADG